MDACSSFEIAVQKLILNNHYDMVISNVGLAHIGNCFLLEQHQRLHPLIPFIVTASAQDHEIAREAMVHAAFGLIATPINPPELISTIQIAHKFHELKKTIALRQKKLDFLYEEQRKGGKGISVPQTYDTNMTRTTEEKLASRQDTLRAYEQTISALERSLPILISHAAQLKDDVEQKALRRLDSLLNLARQGGQTS